MVRPDVFHCSEPGFVQLSHTAQGMSTDVYSGCSAALNQALTLNQITVLLKFNQEAPSKFILVLEYSVLVPW